jgi:peptidoglycan/xylan/chitin deacetylase (PgdA/CDA1 family)
MISLTFDNGPTPGVTEGVLDVLAAHSVKATFFAVGRELATPEGQSLGRRIVAEGHRLGGHTYTHSKQYGALAADFIATDLARTSNVVEAAGGDRLLFRPYGAGGVIDPLLMSNAGAAFLCDHGYTCVVWNVLPGDWYDPNGWVDHALAGISESPWPVVVLHDVANAALPRLDGFLTKARQLQQEWSQEFPEDCVPIRAGQRTPSFGTLQV